MSRITAFAIVLALSACAAIDAPPDTQATLAVERSCSAYTAVLSSLAAHKSELSGDTIAAVDSTNVLVDQWCLTGSPVPTDPYAAIEQIAASTVSLAEFLRQAERS